MSNCNCTDSVILPTVAEDYAITTGVVSSCAPCEDGVCSTDSEGSVVTAAELDTCCANESVILQGRVGSRRVRFTKSGFIKLVKGVASVVDSVPLALNTLWHDYVKISATRRPIIGDPKAFTYLGIGDEKGNLHGIKGISDEDCSPVWDASAGHYTMRPESENPKYQKGLLPRLTSLELIGYAPIVDGGDAKQVRCLSSLQGSGIIVVNSVATVDSECNCPGCDPSPSFASVASFLPNPTTGTLWSLKFNVATGLHYWSADA